MAHAIGCKTPALGWVDDRSGVLAPGRRRSDLDRERNPAPERSRCRLDSRLRNLSFRAGTARAATRAWPCWARRALATEFGLWMNGVAFAAQGFAAILNLS